MPVYEYECLPNHHRFDVRQSINDEPIRICSVCGEPVRRVIQPVGIVFKGSGFYATDSRKSTSSSTSPGNTDGKAAESKKDTKVAESKSDSKSTETKGDAKPASPKD